jgi:phosphate transport system substrate-binding protein
MSFIKIVVPAIALVVLNATSVQARDQLQVGGSSTVLPFSTVAAEAFGDNQSFPTPVVEGGGTGAGIKKFCQGVGENTLDIANASRKMKASEVALCAKNGVTDIQEVMFGFDGIVFASDINGASFAFSAADWYNALAAEVVVNGKLVPNPYTKWSEVDPKLPEQEILAFVPGTKHGTREVFDLKVLETGCKAFKADRTVSKRAGGDKAKTLEGCISLRTDGRVVEIDGDYTETLARLAANNQGIGIFGLSFYENNTDKLKVASFGGVTPSQETVASGVYKVSRPLFFYVKMQHIGVIPGLKEFAEYFVSDEVAGSGGLLESNGLVVDPNLSKAQSVVANGKKM